LARRFIRSGARRGARRATFWESATSLTTQTLTDGGTIAAVTAIVSEAQLDNVPNPTLVRIRGQVFARLGSNGEAQSDLILISHAIMVVDAKQFAIGITAMPLPITDNSEDYLWYGSQYVGNNAFGTPLTAPSSYTADRLLVDSKAMRKITLNQVLVIVSEMVQLSGTAGADVQCGLNFRMLFKK